MEHRNWIDTFQEILQEDDLLSDQWTLAEAPLEFVKTKKYCQYGVGGKGKFLCNSCHNSWTSMNCRIIFYFSPDRNNRSHTVLYELFGQKCKRRGCRNQVRFEKNQFNRRNVISYSMIDFLFKAFQGACWYDDEIERIVIQLIEKMKQKIHGHLDPMRERPKREGHMRKPHQEDLCEACQKGKCRIAELNLLIDRLDLG